MSVGYAARVVLKKDKISLKEIILLDERATYDTALRCMLITIRKIPEMEMSSIFHQFQSLKKKRRLFHVSFLHKNGRKLPFGKCYISHDCCLELNTCQGALTVSICSQTDHKRKFVPFLQLTNPEEVKEANQPRSQACGRPTKKTKTSVLSVSNLSAESTALVSAAAIDTIQNVYMTLCSMKTATAIDVPKANTDVQSAEQSSVSVERKKSLPTIGVDTTVASVV